MSMNVGGIAPSQVWGNSYVRRTEKAAENQGTVAKPVEGRLSSGIIGFSGIGNGEEEQILIARYASNSTSEKPIVEVTMQKENGEKQCYQVEVRRVDSANATQLEMFALCAHQDTQNPSIGSVNRYMKLMGAASQQNVEATDVTEFCMERRNWDEIEENQTQARGNAFIEHMNGGGKSAPYSGLAKDGIIEYKGVTFVCDYEHNSLCLGDTSNPSKCLVIPLSKGGSLVVNRENLGDLTKAITMFSPEDIKRILTAIANDKRAQEILEETEETESEAIQAGESDDDQKEMTVNKLFDGDMDTNVVEPTKDDTITREEQKEEKEQEADLNRREEFDESPVAIFRGESSRERALTDQRYTDQETGITWYVGENGSPYLLDEDAKRLQELCDLNGENYLRRLAEMTGLMQELDENITAYVGRGMDIR